MNDPSSALPLDELDELIAGGSQRSAAPSRGWSGDEARLIERCLAGDDVAFDELVQSYQDMVFNLSYRLLGNYEESVDLSQEVFLQVYRKLGTFRRDASLRTWIYRIVFTRAKNQQRWWKRRLQEMTAVSLDDVDANPNLTVRSKPGGEPVSPYKTLERKEVGELLLAAIAKLPFTHRSILLLKEIEGLSYDEIAETLDVPVGPVKSRLARARRSLRDVLDPKVFGIPEEV